MKDLKVKKVSAPKLQRLTLHKLFSSNEEIWVRNKTGSAGHGREAGNIVMQVGSGAHIDIIAVPPGNDPVCLTDQATHEMLRNCMDLVKHINNGALELLDPSAAESYYTKNKERKEAVEAKIKRLLNKEREDVPAPKRVDGFSDEELRPVSKQKKSKILDEMNPGDKRRQTVLHNVHPKVNDVCLKAKHGAITEHDALETLMEQAPTLTEQDYQYVIHNAAFAGLKRWAKQQFNKLLSDDE